MVGRPLDLKTDAGMEKLEAGVRAQLQRALEKIDRGLEEASEGRALVLAGRARCILHFSKNLQIFGGLVLGCIKTKFCKKICV